MRPFDQAMLDRLGEVLDLPDDVSDLTTDGYLDLTGADDRPATGVAQRLMLSRAVPVVYERWWRPALGRIAKGIAGPSMREEERSVRRLLDLRSGTMVLDIACGPGNFTRAFADVVGARGLAVGVDVSAAMLARAVADTDAPNVAYVRAGAADLPVRPGAVDAVCCFAALHLFGDPAAAIDTMAGALADGGRLAVLTSCRPRGLPFGPLATAIGRVSGMRVFGPEEVTGALTRRGLEITAHRVAGATQIVGARRPA